MDNVRERERQMIGLEKIEIPTTAAATKLDHQAPSSSLSTNDVVNTPLSDCQIVGLQL